MEGKRSILGPIEFLWDQFRFFTSIAMYEDTVDVKDSVHWTNVLYLLSINFAKNSSQVLEALKRILKSLKWSQRIYIACCCGIDYKGPLEILLLF